ncbi:MAG: TonB-dependent receptor [Phenylobacterium sp.]|uniref:TonB-dependent receptor domain-containing protein n=1 Tax=Phenylobacterium sp. TaxID=1871053 RepID=UPI002723A4FA|nr:TonB-dependent receptor [Phenylobacterium sp.]MDO8901552.1 TonB-dependent receptor [Phenylobacterium sp.]MDP2214661.1 TonB-dependent receptor [Phenylobacterium sp.]
MSLSIASSRSWVPSRRAALLASLAWLIPLAPAVADDATDLAQVVVTPMAGPQALRDAPATISVVSRAELEARPIADLSDALRDEPGVNITGIGMTRRGISLRGMPVEHTLVLVDGRRISAVGGLVAHADYDLAWTPVEAIERIEVVRGPMSSLYGADALGGVVNIITRSATDAWVRSATLNGSVPERGAGRSYQMGAYAGGPLVEGVLGLSLYADSTGRDPTYQEADPRQAELEGRRALNASATLSWTPDDSQRIDLTYGAGTDFRYRDTVTTGTAPVYYRFSDDITRQQISASHRGDFSFGQTLARAYRSEVERVNIRSRNQTPSGTVRIVESVVDGHVSTTWGAHQLSAGGEARRQELRNPAVNAQGRSEADQYGLFIQDAWSITEQWSLVGGARFDHHDTYDWQTSPRLYTVFHLNERLTLKGGIGRGFKAPSLTQLSPDYQVVAAGGRFTVFGNPDLKPEIGTTYEASADYAGEGWSARLGVFQNDLEDLVETQCVRLCGIRGREVRVYGNVAEARIRGLELGGDVNLPAQLNLSANLTRMETENRLTGQDLLERPKTRANATLRWRPTPGLSAQLRGQYVGEQTVSTGRLPDYSLWSLEASQRLFEGVTLRVGVENLTDQRLAEKSGSFTYAEPGRLYHLGFNLSF